MSKRIIIDEAGLPKALTVDALRTSKQGGGSEDWLPVDETNLVELDIGGSGTYRASNYGAYGIAMARVTPKYGGGATSKAAQQPVFENLHTPAIREGGNPKYMGARLIKTNLQGGGTCLWVPKDEANLESKYVDHSGTYPASADNCYGYSQITVGGVDVEITQDKDGDDVAKITDGGVVTEEKLPSEIRIEREPYFTGPYGDRAYISFDGLLVKAYTASGRLWKDETHPDGIIPMNELIFPVTVTDITKVKDGSERDVTGTDLIAPVYLSHVWIGDIWSVFASPYTVITDIEGGIVYAFRPYDETNSICGLVSLHPATIKYARQSGSFPGKFDVSTPITIDGKTAYVSVLRAAKGIGWTWTESAAQDMDTGYAAALALLGTKPIGGQPVPVQFARPYDGLVLEDEFRVDVVELTQGGQGDD